MRGKETPVDGAWQRCFIALAPDQPTRDALSAIEVPVGARRVPYEQLHLTMTFIGKLTVDLGEQLAEALADHNAPLEPARVTNIEHWPSAARPRLMVTSLAMTDDLVKLDWRIRSLMIELGLPVDARSFRPHITLARFGREAGPAAPCERVREDMQAQFESLVLYSSTLARHGARYQALAKAALR